MLADAESGSEEGSRAADNLKSTEQKRNDDQEAGLRCQLVTRPLHELRPHPSYAQHQLSVSASKLSWLAVLGHLACREPIVVTRNGDIIDGRARTELARRKGRQTILCLEYDLTDEETLRWLIKSHRPSRGLNSYSRVLLGLDLEPCLQEFREIAKRSMSPIN